MDIEAQLLSITRQFLQELQAERALQAVTLDASLDSELGIDSLSRVELFNRIENEFIVRFPTDFMAKANSLRDILKFIQQNDSAAKSKSKPHSLTPTLETTALNLSAATTFLDVITLRATEEPERPHVYLQDEHGEETIIRYGQLYENALRVANNLRQRGIKTGDTIALMLPTNAEFFYAFCGVLLAGAVPVPIYPPFRADRIEDYIKREAKILSNAEARMLITFASAEMLSKMLHSFIPSLHTVTTVSALMSAPATPIDAGVNATDTMLIQYTSGSTGDPKGVQLTHANFLANVRALGQGMPILPTDVVVSWLPLYHDMGLMNWLGSLYFGIPATIMSPLVFLARPEQWLWAIHYHRATISGAPNFAYELCLRRINPSHIEGLDLSSWQVAFSGAEAVNPKTMERFSKKFAPFGFKKETMTPVYGLAENTVGLTFPATKRAPRVEQINRDMFQQENKAILATPENNNTLEFVACGQALPQHEIRIVDDEGKPVADRTIGNIQFKGPSAMVGYFNNPAATKKIFQDGWWHTGDLGYLADHDLFITGRKKDLIIKAGKNYHPEEIEEITNQVADIRKGCVIAFGVQDAQTGTEKLIIVAETYVQNARRQQQLRAAVIEKLSTQLGVPPDQVILVPPKTVLKTSSGKLQRSATREAYLNNNLTHKLPVKLQLTKLVLLSAWEKIIGLITLSAKLIYTAYALLLFSLTLPFMLISMLLPRKAFDVICRLWARNLIRCIFCPINVNGKENLKHDKPVIYVANHASYADAILLLGILPAGSLFVAKKEVLQTPLLRLFVRKLGFLTVDRMDFSKSIEDTKQIEIAAREGRSLILFPEGTFSYASGLRPFKLGAFNLSAATGLPICPVAINGTRQFYRGTKLILSPRIIYVHVGKQIVPKENSWNEVIRLHALARAEIAKYCGEPAVDVISAGIPT